MTPSGLGMERKYRLAKSGALKARKTVWDMNVPAVRPTVCAVEAYERFAGDMRVRAHPNGTN